jgi:hypothetical protein
MISYSVTNTTICIYSFMQEYLPLNAELDGYFRPLRREYIAQNVNGILWCCAANMGRSPLAEEICKKYYPDNYSHSAGLAYWHFTVVQQNREVHPDTIRVLRESNINRNNLRRYIGNFTNTFELNPKYYDLFILDTSLIWLITPEIRDNARFIFATDLLDPSLVKDCSIYSALKSTYRTLDILIDKKLPTIISKAKKGDYGEQTLDNVIFPFGIPETLNR